MRTFGRIAAIFMLACIPLSFFYWYGVVHQPGLAIRLVAGQLVVAQIRDSAAVRAGVRVGDVVDQRGLTVGDRVRLIAAPVWQPFVVPLEQAGRRFTVPLADVVRTPVPPSSIVDAIVIQLVCGVGLVLAAVVLWRRPGPLAVAFGAYAIGGLYALPTAQFFSFLPEPWFSAVVVSVNVLVGTLPQLALIAFALRFPGPLQGSRGRITIRVFDVVLVALCLLSAVRTVQVATLADFDDPLLDTAPSLLATVALVAIVLVRYARTRGDTRRRLGWVAVGSILTAIAYSAINFEVAGLISAPVWAGIVFAGLQGALPIAFAYAILRHRVVDLDFAINRTVVYGAITAALVVGVSAVDWICGKLISNTRLSYVVEAIATISFGAALSWLHGRVERGVDRVFFRSRYVAAKRIESRIAALGYATTTPSIDVALVDEVVQVVHVASAAVFRRTDAATFARSAAYGWDASAAEVSVDHLLVRTLRADERSVDLREAAIEADGFPAGAARPNVAIPIVVRHEFLGFVLYGHRPEEASLDPEEVALLERLVGAAAAAYDAVDAAEWRRRALALQPIRALG